jgi:hypothetical protein
MGSAFAVALAAHLREALRPTWAAPLAATAIVLASAHWLEGMWTGQGDLPLAAFLTLSVLALFQWRQTDGPSGRRWFALAVLFAGAAAFTKYEGLFRVGVVGIALGVDALARRRGPVAALGPAVAYLVGAGVLFAPWLAFRALHGVAVHDEHIAGFQWQALPATLRALWDTLTGLRAGGAWLVVLLALVLGAPRLVRGPTRLLGLVVGGELLATVLGFLLTNGPPERQVYVTGTRLLFHTAPAALVLAALALGPLLRPRDDAGVHPPADAGDLEVATPRATAIPGPDLDAH